MAPGESWASVGAARLALRLREQTHCGDPRSDATTGLVAYVAGEPVGWCAVEPRPSYPRMLRNNRVPWEGRNEDKSDGSVWAVTCFVVRKGFRRRGIGSALARAAVDFARCGGARAVEAYPMTTKEALSGELHVGTHGMFIAAGFTEIGRPSIRRAVMRVDFTPEPLVPTQRE
jgi:GNAT superfamily N-acetyltransferase